MVREKTVNSHGNAKLNFLSFTPKWLCLSEVDMAAAWRVLDVWWFKISDRQSVFKQNSTQGSKHAALVFNDMRTAMRVTSSATCGICEMIVNKARKKKPALRYNKKHSPKLSTGWLGCLAKYTAFVLRGRLIWTVSVTVCMLDDSLRLRLMIRVMTGARTPSKEQSNWEFRSHPRHLLLNK